MTVGIFTPSFTTTQMKSFDIIRGTFADKKFQFNAIAGPHAMIQVQGCQPVFVSINEPATEATGLLGMPVFPGADFVLPIASAFWVYSPYESQVVYVTSGTLT